MVASKENARQALIELQIILDSKSSKEQKASAESFLRDFLIFAERKLPSEAAYAREKARRAAKGFSG